MAVNTKECVELISEDMSTYYNQKEFIKTTDENKSVETAGYRL